MKGMTLCVLKLLCFSLKENITAVVRYFGQGSPVLRAAQESQWTHSQPACPRRLQHTCRQLFSLITGLLFFHLLSLRVTVCPRPVSDVISHGTNVRDETRAHVFDSCPINYAEEQVKDNWTFRNAALWLARKNFLCKACFLGTSC